jgi:TolB-like protein
MIRNYGAIVLVLSLGLIVGCATGQVRESAREGNLDSLVAPLVEGIAPYGGDVVGVEGDAVYVNLGASAGVERGQVLDIYRFGGEITDPKTGETLGYTSEKVGAVEVDLVQGKLIRSTIIKKPFPPGAIRVGDKALLSGRKRQRIAIAEFEASGGDRLGAVVSERIIAKVVRWGRLEVVERNRLAKVMEEYRLSQAGLVEPSTAKEIGRLLGVDGIITGTAIRVGNRVRISARLIEVESGRVLAAGEAALDVRELGLEARGEQRRTPMMGPMWFLWTDPGGSEG